jgi:hypothetical protein
MIPTFDQIGLAAAFILFFLRVIQGLCLGGQYGGAKAIRKLWTVCDSIPWSRSKIPRN